MRWGIAVSGSQKRRLSFHVRSPAKRATDLPESGVEFSRLSSDEDLKLLMPKGRVMIVQLTELLTAEDDYVRCFLGRLEMTQPDFWWQANFSEVAALLIEWQGGEKWELCVARFCPENQVEWVQSLIDSLG